MDAYDPEERPALEREGRAVEALLPEIWTQLPPIHRRVLGGIVDCVHVFDVSGARCAGAVYPCHPTEGFAGVSVAYLEEPWERTLRLRVVEGLARACANGTAAWLAGSRLGTRGIPAEREGTPAAAWWEAIQRGPSARRSEAAALLERLANAFVLIWGYGELWAEDSPLDTIFDPSPDEWTFRLEAEIGKMYRVLHRRIEDARRSWAALHLP